MSCEHKHIDRDKAIRDATANFEDAKELINLVEQFDSMFYDDFSFNLYHKL